MQRIMNEPKDLAATSDLRAVLCAWFWWAARPAR
jgi:hypothetical protein